MSPLSTAGARIASHGRIGASPLPPSEASGGPGVPIGQGFPFLRIPGPDFFDETTQLRGNPGEGAGTARACKTRETSHGWLAVVSTCAEW